MVGLVVCVHVTEEISFLRRVEIYLHVMSHAQSPSIIIR